MVLYFHNSHTYPHTFETVSLAYFNRYPNPYSSHVLSTDTLDKHIDSEGRLHQTKLVMKAGRLPKWVKPFLGKISTSWIIERTVVDPKNKTMQTYTRNLDHTKIIQIEEHNQYTFDPTSNHTTNKITVKFSSGFRGLGIKNRIESWSKTKFDENLMRSRQGLRYVMDSVRDRLYSLQTV
ncbi:hypothetical protein OGAPHI_006639 [Ogataea philodendri]|uniref:PRELI/MSF1 domain-containing protein n=1 Tax=Ogataea philodendri TaxID=1378263 RepID=A0A9P8NX75_9ASCO|nr:uncharacterized protein OGAPHI_006639 [Ogataea philodendri]KAH3661232.1 hypothetical protein OGAPHI_006639 [Ogataea philodendri]